MKRIILGAVCALVIAPAQGADFFSTEKSEELFTFGARIGVNTSNRTIGDKAYPGCYHHESWGTGFDLGAVVNLNFRDYLSIQPGFFFEARNGSYTLMGTESASLVGVDGASSAEIAQAGDRCSYNFTIPVMAVVGFNVTDDLRWTVEAGPYVSFVLDSKLKNKRFVVNGSEDARPLFRQKAAGVDFGIKMGTGIRILDHYYVGAHYMAGCIQAWDDKKIGGFTRSFGGLTKAWVFSIGYDF